MTIFKLLSIMLIQDVCQYQNVAYIMQHSLSARLKLRNLICVISSDATLFHPQMLTLWCRNLIPRNMLKKMPCICSRRVAFRVRFQAEHGKGLFFVLEIREQARTPQPSSQRAFCRRRAEQQQPATAKRLLFNKSSEVSTRNSLIPSSDDCDLVMKSRIQHVTVTSLLCRLCNVTFSNCSFKKLLQLTAIVFRDSEEQQRHSRIKPEKDFKLRQ